MERENVFFGIDGYMAMYAPYIKRAEARELAQCYVVGLIMDGDRKFVEPMSENVHASERGMQRLLTEVKWDRDGGFGEYRRRMLAETADPQGVLVIDDTGCVDVRKKTYMPADVHYWEKWQKALDLIDQARSDGAPH